MNKFKRQPIVFNMECEHQRSLYEWCIGQSVNFSGFCKDVLFLFKNSQSGQITSKTVAVTTGAITGMAEVDDFAAMSDIL